MTKGRTALAVVISALVLAGASGAGAAGAWTAPKTAWGDPDLRGTWPLDSVARTPMQRPPQYGDRLFLSDAEFAAAEKGAADMRHRYEVEEKVGKLSVGHWTEYGAPSRQTSLIVEPKNGRLPEMTPEGKRLEAMGAGGCVVLGELGYYGRFGFESDPELRYGDAPAAYFQRLIFKGPAPPGQVRFHPVFEA